MSKVAKILVLSCLMLGIYAQAAMSQPSTGNAVQSETQVMKEQLNNRVQELLDAPDGTFDIESKDGKIFRVKIKATMEVSSSFRGARGDRLARESATRKARAAFSTYLTSNVVFVESGNEATLEIVDKGQVEQGQFTQASASSINVASQSFQQGLVPLMQHCAGEGEYRQCVVVMGWSQKSVNAAMQAVEIMKPTPTSEEEKPKTPTTPATPEPNSGNSKTTIKLGNEDF